MMHPLRCPGCATLTDPFETNCIRCGTALGSTPVEAHAASVDVPGKGGDSGVHVRKDLLEKHDVLASEERTTQFQDAFCDALPVGAAAVDEHDSWPLPKEPEQPTGDIPFWEDDADGEVVDVIGHAIRPHRAAPAIDLGKLRSVAKETGSQIRARRTWVAAGAAVLLLGGWIIAALTAEPSLVGSMPTRIGAWQYNTSLSATARGDATSLLSSAIPGQNPVKRLAGVYSFASSTVNATDPESLIVAADQAPAVGQQSFAGEESRIMAQVNGQGFQAVGQPASSSMGGSTISCYETVDGSLGVNGTVCVWQHRDVLGVTVWVSQVTHSRAAAARTTSSVVTALLH